MRASGAVSAVPDAVAPPPGNPRFPGVDGLRALAALAVVVFHADQFSVASGTPLGRALCHLDVGVAVFFAITGFLLYRPYFASAVGDAPRTPTRVFYRRRVLRIIPAYWVALLVLAPLLTFAYPAGIENILFIQIYRPAWVRSGIPPGWSVCVEMSFYLLLPLFAAALGRVLGGLDRSQRRRAELRLLAAMWVASIIVRVLLHRYVSDYYWLDPLPGTLAWFCGGMALAVLSVDPGRYTHRFRNLARDHPGRCWLAALVLYAGAVAATTHFADATGVLLFIDYGAIAALILAPLVFGTPKRLMTAKPLAWLGLISYGIYLYHYPLMLQLGIDTSSRTVNLVVYAAVGATIAIACGAASYYIVERPALRFKNQRRPR